MNNNSSHQNDSIKVDSLEESENLQTNEAQETGSADSSNKYDMAKSAADLDERAELHPKWDKVISLSGSEEATTETGQTEPIELEETIETSESLDPFSEDDFSDSIEDLDRPVEPPKKSKLKEFAFMGNSNGTAVAEKKSKKKLWITLGCIAALLIVAYLAGAFYFQDKFLPNTRVNGENIAGMTLEQAQNTINDLSQERTVEILGKDGVKSEVKASDVGFTLTEAPDLENVLNQQNSFAWPVNLIVGTNQDNASTIDDQALTDKVASLEIVAGPQVVKTENARAEYNGEEFVVKSEVFGTEVDVPKLIEDVRQSLISGNPMINLEENQDYVMPVTLEDNETLAQSVEKLNSINGTITYDFKTAQEVLDKNAYLPWLGTTETGEARVDSNMAAAYVASLAEKYNTRGKKVNFTTSGGEQIQLVDYVVDGWEINQPQEVNDLMNAILAGQDVTKEPAYSHTGRDRAQNNTITGTYLEISIPDQTMWFYKDGQPIVETAVVTGDPYSGHSTSEGLFEIQGKSMYVTLVGPGYASPVTFWLPFDGGIGVHDSSWRGSYGGSIYLGNGSHGCVNTPYGAVRTIYNNIEEGQPVVVY